MVAVGAERGFLHVRDGGATSNYAVAARGEQAPAVYVVPATGGIAVVVPFTDLLLLRTADSPSVSPAGDSTDATFALVRRDPVGRVLEPATFDDTSDEVTLSVR